MMQLSRTALGLLAAITSIVFALLYGPLFIPIISSLFAISHGDVQWNEPSLSSYRALIDNQGILEAFKNTLIVGFTATFLSLVIGTLLAIHYCGGRSVVRELMQFTVFLPFLMPPIITGLSLLIFFRETGVPRSLLTVIAGHTVFVQALAYRTIVVRLRSLGPSMVEASADLGASAWQTLTHIVLPNLKSTLIGAGVLSFALSFDETLISLLVTGTDSTLPIRLWSMMRLGFTPDINALVAIILGVTAIMCILAVRQLLPAELDRVE
ncbi:MAG: ABC transporter permease [Rhizobiales bacterium]|nr:ABC transporter permease [Hyphomicrobiales bacterium]MBI3674188.1 ABC transporter permease [Hyphomicrobiales bacterium]